MRDATSSSIGLRDSRLFAGVNAAARPRNVTAAVFMLSRPMSTYPLIHIHTHPSYVDFYYGRAPMTRMFDLRISNDILVSGVDDSLANLDYSRVSANHFDTFWHVDATRE